MGGRGSSISDTGYKVTHDGSVITYRFRSRGGVTYYSSGNDRWAETPLNLTKSQFLARVKSNGATVEKVKVKVGLTKAEKAEREKILNEAYANDKTFVKGSRAARKRNRAVNRARRSRK